MNKCCIFHIPNKIDRNKSSGSQIRPLKMLGAFQNIGYEVDVVMGYGKERKRQVEKIKENVKNGKQYDFLYSESSTMPTLLTEKHHLPLYPFLDFGFFKFCKDHGIKIGLFYRDIFWRFPVYKNNVHTFKRWFAIAFYKYDLKKYNELLNVLYLPSREMGEILPFVFKGKIEELPPAIDEDQFLNDIEILQGSEKLKIFYVGGLGEIYNLELMCKVTQDLEFIDFTICCRREEWEKEKYRYERYLNPRIKIVHKSGSQLNKYYEEAHLMCKFLKPHMYWDIAMPVKLYEYIGSGKPILATNYGVADKFIEEYDIGWNINYSYDKLAENLKHIYHNQNEIVEKSKNIKKIRDDNTWEARAKKVAEQLMNIK